MKFYLLIILAISSTLLISCTSLAKDEGPNYYKDFRQLQRDFHESGGVLPSPKKTDIDSTYPEVASNLYKRKHGKVNPFYFDGPIKDIVFSNIKNLKQIRAEIFKNLITQELALFKWPHQLGNIENKKTLRYLHDLKELKSKYTP